MTAGPTGLTGCTSNSESFELVRFDAGLAEGSGRSNGSDADLSTVAVVFGAGLARLGRVDWAETAQAASKNAAPALKSRGIKVDLFIMTQIVFGRGWV
jgi:hypothetical protein